MTHHIDDTHAIIHSVLIAPLLVTSAKPMPPDTNDFEDAYKPPRIRSSVRNTLSLYTLKKLYSLSNTYTVSEL